MAPMHSIQRDVSVYFLKPFSILFKFESNQFKFTYFNKIENDLSQ